MSKLLIYGSNGWIGHQFINLLRKNYSETINFVEGIERCNDIENIKTEIDNEKPTHIISFIGRTHGVINEKVYGTIDYLEQPGKLKENVRDNLFSPLVLALLCKEKNIHYTYLGTGCIFKYDETHPFGKELDGFTEESLPNFFGSSYSTVKGYTDQLMKFFENHVLNLRIRMPITETMNPRNFITKITNYEKICSIPNSMTVLPELLPFAIDMMLKNKTGTINLTNPGLISHNEILTMFQEIVDPSFTWKNFSLEEQSEVLESDRSNNFLDTNKLTTMYPQIQNIKTSVRQVLTKYKDTYIPKKENNKKENKHKKENQKKSTIIPHLNVDEIDYLLITGGYGFIASNFINHMFKKYPTVKIINLDAMYYCANINNVNKDIIKDKDYTFIKGNLQSYETVRNIFIKYNITHVIHFAAQSHVQNSFNESIQYTNDNIVGTHNLLEVSRCYGKNIKKFIHVSTDEVYGESQFGSSENKKTEQSILCPTNPYSATKAAAELLAQSYIHSFNMPIIISRGNNVYGPNQYPEKVIPLFIEQLLKNKKLTIQGDGSCIRGFLHVYDVCNAFECILTNGNIGEIYNIGCDEHDEYSILQLAKILIQLIKNTKNSNQYITFIEDRPFNDKRYFISNEKIKSLGWKKKIEFLDGLKELVEVLKKKLTNEETLITDIHNI